LVSTIKRAAKPLTILLVGFVIIFMAATLKPKPEPLPLKEPELLEVSTLPILFETHQMKVKTQGTVKPSREVDLISQVSGEVVKVSESFAEGGVVYSDTVLVQVDQRDYQLALIRAKAKVADAEQLLALEKGRSRQAQREWRDLGNDEANQLFLRKPQLKSAEANLQAAIADKDKASLDLDRTSLGVPFSGRIRETMAEVGQYVTAGSKIARIYDSSEVEIRLPLTDHQAELVELPFETLDQDQQPMVKIYGSVAGRQQVWQGRLARLEASLDTRSRFYYVVVEVKNEAENTSSTENALPLMVGLFVEAEITGREISNVVTVPKHVLFKRNRLFVVDKLDVVSEREVKLLSINDDVAWVTGAFNSGDRIALTSQLMLFDGMKVKPVVEPSVGQQAAGVPSDEMSVNGSPSSVVVN